MKLFYPLAKRIFHQRRRFVPLICALLCCVFLLVCTACKKETDYFSYVSEICDNMLLAEDENISVRAYAIKRESPYLADGIPREQSTRAEFFIVTPSGDQDCSIYFTIGKKQFRGDTSYDNVKAQFYYSCSVDISETSSLTIQIVYGDTTHELTAKSVKNEKTLSPKKALDCLRKSKEQVFTDLTDEYGFNGEIYIRLLYEDSVYYYIGITNRNGKTHAFLLNGQTGVVLAERKN